MKKFQENELLKEAQTELTAARQAHGEAIKKYHADMNTENLNAVHEKEFEVREIGMKVWNIENFTSGPDFE